MLPSLLAVIQSSTYGTKYIIETSLSTKFGVEIFDRVAWAFGPCIAVFERPDFGWQESTSETVYRYCTQHIAQNMYKVCHMKRINALFKQAARHKKP
jgi:hypothetical protein